jgi:trichoplein keratin filament-binding protein
MKSARNAHLQQTLARRRETEHIKFEKSAALHKYYENWTRTTAKFETWTNPEFLKKAELEVQKQEEEAKKLKELEERREQQRQQRADEKAQFEAELKVKKRPKSKTHATSLLEDLHKKYLETAENRRRQELEAQLYQRIRSPILIDRDKIILESKNEHQAMAKLNWLDRQIENYVKEEKEKNMAQERQLELEKELCKHDELLLQIKVKSDEEAEEHRKQQEKHLQELELYEKEADELREREAELRHHTTEIGQEIVQLQEISRARRERVFRVHNLRRVKMVLRERSEIIRKDLQQDLISLERISKNFQDDSITCLRAKFQQQYSNELQRHTYIDSLYDSEAKEEFLKLDLQWTEESIVREQQLKCLLIDQQQAVEEQLKACIARQKDLIKHREIALDNIEFLNQLIKKLLMNSAESASGHKKLDEVSGILKRVSIISDKTDSSDSAMEGGVPRFGRKKIAWC